MRKRMPLILTIVILQFSCGVMVQPTSTPPAPALAATPTFTLIPSATATTPPTPTETPGVSTLRLLAEKNRIQVGTYLNGQWFNDSLWREIVAREFDLAVISSGFYWESMESTQGQFNFSPPVDVQIDFAQSNGMAICGHALLLAQSPYIPNWLAYGNSSKDKLSAILLNFIVQVMSRYKGKIGTYIVVEDAPLPADMQYDVFYQKFGYDYVDLAFQIARETDPSAILIYNAGDDETADRPASQLTHQIVERLQAKRLIDGVGFEMHLEATDAPSKEDVIAEMRSYSLPVHVTEIDVDISGLPGTREEGYAMQARIYGDMLSACLESGVCQSFSLWGIGDKYSWLRRASPIADPTPFDDNLNPKPAYFALLDALR